MSKNVSTIQAVFITALLTVLAAAALVGCFSSDHDASQQAVSPIDGSDPLALKSIAGTYRWTHGYYRYSTGREFLVVDMEEQPYDSVIITFNPDNTYKIEGSVGNPRMYFPLYIGNFSIESISFEDIDQEDRLLMKDVESRCDTSWYRVVKYDSVVFDLRHSLYPIPYDLELLISYASDEDIVFYSPVSKEFDFAETSFVKKIAPAIESDQELLDLIAGAYSDRTGYDSETSDFVEHALHERKMYTFNSDSSFKIHAARNQFLRSYVGRFNIREVVFEDIDADARTLMPLLEERRDIDLFRIDAYNVEGTMSDPKLTLYTSKASDEDIVIYILELEEAVSAIKLWDN